MINVLSYRTAKAALSFPLIEVSDRQLKMHCFVPVLNHNVVRNPNSIHGLRQTFNILKEYIHISPSTREAQDIFIRIKGPNLRVLAYAGTSILDLDRLMPAEIEKKGVLSLGLFDGRKPTDWLNPGLTGFSPILSTWKYHFYNNRFPAADLIFPEKVSSLHDCTLVVCSSFRPLFVNELNIKVQRIDETYRTTAIKDLVRIADNLTHLSLESQASNL